MPARKGIPANGKAIERLIKARGLLLKQVVEPTRRKTLDRARKGESVSEDFLQYLAQQLDVDVTEISLPQDHRARFQRKVSMKFYRTESLKGFPKGLFEVSDFEDMNLLHPFVVEARFEVGDPTEEQSELAAQLVESAEVMTEPQKPSEMIRAKGRLNVNIKKLKNLGIHLYVGSYKHRHGALPFVDADQTELAAPAISIRLLLIFTENGASRAIQRQVDLGMSLDELKEDRAWLSHQLEKDARQELDDEELRYLERLRTQARQVWIDLRI